MVVEKCTRNFLKDQDYGGLEMLRLGFIFVPTFLSKSKTLVLSKSAKEAGKFCDCLLAWRCLKLGQRADVQKGKIPRNKIAQKQGLT